MRVSTLLKPLSFLPAIILMYVIFTFSAQDGELSSSVSYKASYMIVKSADYIFDTHLEEYQMADYAYRINGITRKLAHMTEYFLLAIAVSFPLYVYGLRGILLVLIAGAVCVGFACGDEYHQSFVAGRAASKKDVAIDSFGVLMGIFLVRIIGWTGRHAFFRPAPEDASQRMTSRQLRKLEKEQKRLAKEQAAAEQRYYKERKQKAIESEKLKQSGARRTSSLYNQPDPYRSQSDPYRSQSDPYRFQTDPYRSQTDPYDPYDLQDPGGPYYDEPAPGKPDISSDELSEDMPLSRLFHPDRR